MGEQNITKKMNEKDALAQQEQQQQPQQLPTQNQAGSWNWPYRHDPKRHNVPRSLRLFIYMLTPFVIIPGICLVFGAFYLCHRLLYSVKFNAAYRDIKTEEELKDEIMWFNIGFLLVLTIMYIMLK